MTVREAVATALALFQGAYPNVKINEYTPQVWEEVLKDLSPESILYAAKYVLSNSEVPALPAVGLIRKYALYRDESIARMKRSMLAEIAYLKGLERRTEEEQKRLDELLLANQHYPFKSTPPELWRVASGESREDRDGRANAQQSLDDHESWPRLRAVQPRAGKS